MKHIRQSEKGCLFLIFYKNLWKINFISNDALKTLYNDAENLIQNSFCIIIKSPHDLQGGELDTVSKMLKYAVEHLFKHIS